MKEGRDNWLLTFSGIKVHPLDPKPEEIRVVDIAHGLSNICRFGGQCRVFYSVAEHSVRVAHLLARSSAPKEMVMWGLMHDAAEAYLGDVIRPLKGFFPAYKVVEEKVLKTVARKLRLSWPIPAKVKEADSSLLKSEAMELMEPSYAFEFPGKADPGTGTIVPCPPGGAKFMWEKEFKRIFGRTPEEADRE